MQINVIESLSRRKLVKYCMTGAQFFTQQALKLIFLKEGFSLLAFYISSNMAVFKFSYNLGENDKQLWLAFMHAYVCVCQQSRVLAFPVQAPFTFSPSLQDGDCSFKRRLVGSSFFSPDLIQTPISFICTDRCGNSLTSKTNIKVMTACSNSTHICLYHKLASCLISPLSFLQSWVEQVCVKAPPKIIWSELSCLHYFKKLYDKYVFNPYAFGWRVKLVTLHLHF